MTTDNTDNIRLEGHDAYHETRKLMTQKIEAGDMRLRNLMMIRGHYIDHLKKSTGAGVQEALPGIPIVLKDGDLRLDRIHLMTQTFPRSFFEERPHGGTEIIFTSKHNGGEGYQWYIMTWKFKQKKLNITCSHWMIDRNIEERRNTLYFNRAFGFTEKDIIDIQELDTKSMFQSWIKLSDVPQSHYRASTSTALPHALRFDKEQDDELGFVTTTAPYGVWEIMATLNTMLRILDMGEHTRYYIHQQFEHFWNLHVLRAIWGEKNWSTRMIDKDGILKDMWYFPDSSEYSTGAKAKLLNKDWVAVRDKYEEWKDMFVRPPHLQAPTEEEKHLLLPSVERQKELDTKALAEKERLRKQAEWETSNEEAIRKANERFK